MYSYSKNYGLGKIKASRKNKAKIHRKTESKTRKSKRSNDQNDFAYVDAIDEQVKFLRRFKNLGKDAIPVKRLLAFIKTLQRAIHERRLRKNDRYAKEIDEAQRIAISSYQKANGLKVNVKIPTALFERVTEIAKSVKVRPSVAILKRFVGCIGKPYHEVSKRMNNILESLRFMYERGMIRESDPYFSKVKDAQRA